MKKLQSIIMIILINSSLFAAPAAPGVKTFIQADGTRFQGVLKGDAFFNWIQSNGEVVIYNVEDKSYYKAIVDVNKGLSKSSQKVKQSNTPVKASSSFKEKISAHDVSLEMKNKLHILSKKNRPKY